jgi:hypothetical protein
MAEAVYVLCAVTSLLCAGLLVRGYLRSRTRFLLWSSLCFAAMTVNNLLLLLDKVILHGGQATILGVEFALLRAIVAAVALSLLMYGLVWDAE